MAWAGLSEERIEAAFAELLGDDDDDFDDAGDEGSGASQAVPNLPLLVRRANVRFDRELRRVARALGHPEVGPSGLHLLRLVGRRGQPISVLAEQLGVSRQAVGQAVQRLEERELTTRREHWAATLIVCTASGRRLRREVDEAIMRVVWGWGLVADGSRLDDLARDLDVLAQDPRTRFG
jgi:DNA-binding MarR family transcriptional regulator